MAQALQQQIITRALELLSDKSKWTSRAVARNAQGHPCASRDPNAVRFCAVGSLARAAYEVTGDWDNHALLGEIETTILAASGQAYFSLSLLNDHQGYEVVISMFRSAVMAAR